MYVSTGPDQFRKAILRYKLIQSACLVNNLNPVDNLATLFNCTPVDRTSASMMARNTSYSFKWVEDNGTVYVR